MSRGEYNLYRCWELPENENGNDKGYLVCYGNGYESWCPKEQFEKNAIEIGDNEIERFTLEKLIVEKEVKTEYIFGKPYTIVNVKLSNGMILHSGTSCVDPKNYSEEIGAEICMRDIEKQMWFGLGFTLSLAQGLDK